MSADGASGEDFLPFACLFPQQHFCSACVASRALSSASFELLANKRSISQGEGERGRERKKREGEWKYNCQWPYSLQMVHLKSLEYIFFNTYEPQGMAPLPFQKSTEWIKKWMELIKKTKKKHPNGREWRINSVGRWVLVSIWAILIRRIETRAWAKPQTSHLWPPWQTQYWCSIFTQFLCMLCFDKKNTLLPLLIWPYFQTLNLGQLIRIRQYAADHNRQLVTAAF